MFKNIGNKIKIFAKVICFLGIGLSVVYGIIMLTVFAAKGMGAFSSILASILLIALFSLLAWVGSFTIYGLGQLVDNSDKLVENSEKLMIILNSKNSHRNDTRDETAAGDSSWTCSVCGCSVSHTYKTCPFCDYVIKSEHKHEK